MDNPIPATTIVLVRLKTTNANHVKLTKIKLYTDLDSSITLTQPTVDSDNLVVTLPYLTFNLPSTIDDQYPVRLSVKLGTTAGQTNVKINVEFPCTGELTTPSEVDIFATVTLGEEATVDLTDFSNGQCDFTLEMYSSDDLTT